MILILIRLLPHVRQGREKEPQRKLKTVRRMTVRNTERQVAKNAPFVLIGVLVILMLYQEKRMEVVSGYR